jgi:hypothetical protein
MGPGFQVVAKRWAVEQTFDWLNLAAVFRKITKSSLGTTKRWFKWLSSPFSSGASLEPEVYKQTLKRHELAV